MKTLLHLITIFILITLLTPALAQTTRYVATGGNDSSNDCANSGTPCATISHAIDEADADDTIQIDDGNYSRATISKSLTLLSVNDGGAVIDGDGVSQGWAIRIAAGVEDVTIGAVGQGFEINAQPGDLAAVYAVGDNDNLLIEGNTLNGGNGNAFLAGGTGGEGLTNSTLSNNTFTNNGTTTMAYVNGQASLGVNSSNVTFDQNTFTATGAGNGVLLGLETDNAEVTDNIFEGESGYALLELWNAGATISGNSFKNDGTGTAFKDSNSGYNEADIITDNSFIPGAVNIVGKDDVYTSIQPAVDAASDGDMIEVHPGTYETTGQVLIDKDLTIEGVGGTKPVISPDADVTGADPSQAWFLIEASTDFSLNNVELDGNGHFIHYGIRSHGNTTIEEVDFMEIQGSASGNPYNGYAISSFGGTVAGGAGSNSHGSGGAASHLIVNNSTFSQIGRIGMLVKGDQATAEITNNMYTGKGDGDFLDYMVDLGAGGQATITGNTISDNRGVASSDGSASAGILVTTFWGDGTTATIENNTIEDNTTGIFVGFDGSDESDVTAQNNNFSGNETGVVSTNPQVDARYNHWGDDSGPSGGLTDPISGVQANGSGDEVSANVLFFPWLGYTPASVETIVVDPANPQGWLFGNPVYCTPGTTPGPPHAPCSVTGGGSPIAGDFELGTDTPAGHGFEDGPGTPPEGDGSYFAEIYDGGSKVIVARNDYNQVSISGVFAMSIDTYRDPAATDDSNWYINLYVDQDGDAAYDCRLDGSLPAQSSSGVWETTDLYILNWSGASGCSGFNGTLGDFAVANPDAQLIHGFDEAGFPQIVLNQGDTADNYEGYVGNFDAFRIAHIDEGDITWDFEAGAVTLTVQEGWRMLSSPIQGLTYDDMLGDLWTQGTGITGVDYAGGIPNVYTWPNDDDGTDQSLWVPVGNLNDEIEAGTGFLMYVFIDDNYDAPGGDSFDKTITLSGTNHSGNITPTMNSEPGGWTLVGNPYGQPVMFSALTTTNLVDAAYVYDLNAMGIDPPGPINGNGGAWRSISGLYGDIPSGKIAPGQGFFVQNTDPLPSSSSIEFTEDSKTTGGDFYGKESGPRDYVRLEVQGESLYNSVWIRFSDEGSLELGNGDALELQPLSGRYALLGARKTDGTLVDIGHFPLDTQDLEIPLTIEVTRSGTFTITATEMDLPAGMQLYLQDRQTGASIPITNTETFEYSFTLEQAKKTNPDVDPLTTLKNPKKATTLGSDRFMITTSPDKNRSELPTEITLGQNYPNPFNPATVISYQLPVNSQVRLEVYNMLGQQVATLVEGAVEAGTHQVNFDASDLSSGVYLYRLSAHGLGGNQQIFTKKLTLIK